MIILHDDAYYESRKPQPDLGRYQNFMRFIWNPDRRTLFDRNVAEWGQVFFYYFFFFAVLGTIFAVQMHLSFSDVRGLKEPLFKYKSLVKNRGLFENLRVLPVAWSLENPGVGYKPNIPLPLKSPIIWINEKNENTRSKRYVQALTEFLQGYKTNTSQQELKHEDKLSPYSDLKSRSFDINDLGTCGISPYGYTIPIEPCVLIKFNKRLGWFPYYYNQSSVLPETMPDFLKDVIKKSDKFYIWLSCNGADNVDKEHIGQIEYIPTPGFPIEYFPFLGQKDYLSPIVAVKFKNLTSNRLLTVRCITWTSDIEQRTSYYLDFQIMIEK